MRRLMKQDEITLPRRRYRTDITKTLIIDDFQCPFDGGINDDKSSLNQYICHDKTAGGY